MSSKSPAIKSPSPTPTIEWLLLGLEGSGKTALLRTLKHCTGTAAATKPSASSASSASSTSSPAPASLISTTPTNGVERETLALIRPNSNSNGPSLSINIREIGGSMRTTWMSYYSTNSPTLTGIIFMIDTSNPTTLAAAQYELMTLLTSPALLASHFLILLNKTDLYGRLTQEELQKSIRLDDIVKDVRKRNEEVGTKKGEGQQEEKQQQQQSQQRIPEICVQEMSLVKDEGVKEILQQLARLSGSR